MGAVSGDELGRLLLYGWLIVSALVPICNQGWRTAQARGA